MFTNTFSDVEARKELQKDREELQRFIPSITERADYARRVKKANTFPFNYSAPFKSSRGNRYRVILTPTDKNRGYLLQVIEKHESNSLNGPINI